MAEKRLNVCCERALTGAHLRDVAPTHENIAYLFGISVRWVGELRKRGVLPPDAPWPVLFKRMARYKPEAKRVARGAQLAKRRAAADG